jgi:hypothetical protein
MTKACIGHLFRWRDESVTFSRIFWKNRNGHVVSTSEMAPDLFGGE